MRALSLRDLDTAQAGDLEDSGDPQAGHIQAGVCQAGDIHLQDIAIPLLQCKYQSIRSIVAMYM